MNETDRISENRIIIVSNRLPFAVRYESEVLSFVPSVGGLSTGLSSYLESLRDHPGKSHRFLWVGWPGSTIHEEDKQVIRSKSFAEYGSIPVFLSEEEIENFYQGFCNQTIWPLFHYFPVFTTYHDSHWAEYLEVNRRFCQALLEILTPLDTVWIHDYHLMLLPDMLRRQLPSLNIGFFLHIPFPNYEIYRLLPSKWRRAILEGLLGADLIGFHTYDYKQDFLRCVLRILGHDSNLGELLVGSRIVKAEAFPMGIDFAKYHRGACSTEVRAEQVEINQQLKEAKVILSIDRLDYTKGIINRLEAFQVFLDTHPEWRCRVVLLLIVVPSRVDVEHYEMMKNQIERMVGMINGKYGSPSWTPIVYMYKSLTFAPLVAMYSAADIALITPLRDGMNLIAKEYLASRRNKTGILILSEMAGASKELIEAVIINPNNRNEIADAIAEALEMPEVEQSRRMGIMQEQLKRYDVVHWVEDFMDELERSGQRRDLYNAKALNPQDRIRLFEDYCHGKRRLLLLDYDGTLVPFSIRPENAVPGQSLLETLQLLANNPRNEVVIISGRTREFLDQWFSESRISLVAEHGAWIKERERNWKMLVHAADDWKPRLKPLLERYVNRVLGTFIEEKEFALVWHYRGAEPEVGRIAAQELKDHLLALTANIDLHILQGNKTVEIRAAGISKANGGLHFLAEESYDFIACIGDDLTDEDLFSTLPDTAYTIRVGLGGTYARYTLQSVLETDQLLKEMVLCGGVMLAEDAERKLQEVT